MALGFDPTRHPPSVLLGRADVNVEVHFDVVVAHPAASQVGVQADVVVSGVGRGECEAALVRPARVDDNVAVRQVLDVSGRAKRAVRSRDKQCVYRGCTRHGEER